MPTVSLPDTTVPVTVLPLWDVQWAQSAVPAWARPVGASSVVVRAVASAVARTVVCMGILLNVGGG